MHQDKRSDSNAELKVIFCESLEILHIIIV